MSVEPTSPYGVMLKAQAYIGSLRVLIGVDDPDESFWAEHRRKAAEWEAIVAEITPKAVQS